MTDEQAHYLDLYLHYYKGIYARAIYRAVEALQKRAHDSVISYRTNIARTISYPTIREEALVARALWDGRQAARHRSKRATQST